jgi:hypothetical protein
MTHAGEHNPAAPPDAVERPRREVRGIACLGGGVGWSGVVRRLAEGSGCEQDFGALLPAIVMPGRCRC